MTTENPDAEVVREALHYGRRQHDLLMNDGPNRGHQCTGCNKFIYARESFSRLIARLQRAEAVSLLKRTQVEDRDNRIEELETALQRAEGALREVRAVAAGAKQDVEIEDRSPEGG